MCGRYCATSSPEELARLFATVNAWPNLQPSWNMAPTRDAPVVRRHPETGDRHLDSLRWGLIPRWTKDAKPGRQPINARSETAATTPMFRDSLRLRRCIVPADAFYEWQVVGKTKLPHAIARADGQPMAFAGIWDAWRGPGGEAVRTFAILTTEANEQLRPLHERMTVVLEPADWPVWLSDTEGDWAALMRPSAATFRVWPVGAAVGNVRNDGPELLAPVEVAA